MSTSNATLRIWSKLKGVPLGKWLFSTLLAFKAPYFRTISAQFVTLDAQHCTIQMKKRWRVQNHIGTVHAIAMCNMAELAAGVLTEVAVPSSHRWIPKGMTVEYLRKAETDLTATARPLHSVDWAGNMDYPVEVLVNNSRNETVFRAVVNMWVSQKLKK